MTSLNHSELTPPGHALPSHAPACSPHLRGSSLLEPAQQPTLASRLTRTVIAPKSSPQNVPFANHPHVPRPRPHSSLCSGKRFVVHRMLMVSPLHPPAPSICWVRLSMIHRQERVPMPHAPRHSSPGPLPYPASTAPGTRVPFHASAIPSPRSNAMSIWPSSSRKRDPQYTSGPHHLPKSPPHYGVFSVVKSSLAFWHPTSPTFPGARSD